MITTLLILSQLTLLLFVAVTVSLAFRSNAPRAHRVLLTGLICLFVSLSLCLAVEALVARLGVQLVKEDQYISVKI